MKPIKIGLLSKARGNFIIQQKYNPLNKVVDKTNDEVNHHYDALIKAGFEVEIIKWDENFLSNLKKSKVDLFFNTSSIIELSILDEYCYSYVGTDTFGAVSSLDKGLAKRLWVKDGVPTSPFKVLQNVEDCLKVQNNKDLQFPLFIKPLRGRGSAGIDETAIVHNYEIFKSEVEKRLKCVNEPLIIENFIKGREITCGIVGNGENLRALPLLEISKIGDAQFLTFDKKEADSDKFQCPAPLDSDQTLLCQNLTKKAFKSLGLRDYGRFDMILTEKGPFFLDANCFAGLTCTPRERPHSYMGFMAVAENKTSSDFLQEIVNEALKRIGVR